ncbi:MAG: threonine/serine exporter family protein [Clostridia bacterium]|nr:threonine/serine exporter family protein [Clostridia bacterium]
MDSKKLKLILEIAVKLTEVGGEISRVEESVERIAEAYGSVRTDIYATTSNVMVSVETAEGEIITQTRCIGRINNNIEKLDKVNAIIRWVTEVAPVEQEVYAKLEEVDKVKTPSGVLELVYFGVIASAFCIFFGSRNIIEIISSFILGGVVGAISQGLEYINANKLLIRFLCCGVAAFVIRFLVLAKLFPAPDYITIGIIMTLIPGAGITNALRDLFSGDVVTGVLRTIEAVLIAAAMAIGFALPGIIMGGAI